MSGAIVSAVLARGPEDHAARMVLVGIGDNANQSGEAWPSIRYTAERLRLSKSTVLRALEILEQEGWIERCRNKMGKNGNAYLINLDKLQMRPDERGEPTSGLFKKKRKGVRVTPSPAMEGVTLTPQADPLEGVTMTPSECHHDTCLVSPRHLPGVTMTPLYGRTVNEQSVEQERGTAPPLRTEQSYDFEADSAVEIPEGLTPLQYANGALERCLVIRSFKTAEMCADAIKLLAKGEKLSLAKATEVLIQRMLAARERGEVLNNFWFTDEKWKPHKAAPTGAMVGGRSSAAVTPEVAPLSDEELSRYAEWLLGLENLKTATISQMGSWWLFHANEERTSESNLAMIEAELERRVNGKGSVA
jgi:DNA-binding Lrp family transcriptional regulator